ncbi:MAG: endolytic transglycosylase MltG [Abditibacteriaceae bacterium]
MITSFYNRKTLWWIVGAIVFILVIATAVWNFWQYHQKWAAIPMPESTAMVFDEMPPAKLGELLEKKNKVRNAQTFLEAANKINLSKVMPGVYKLPKTAGPMQLARIFAQPPALVKVTFPEGWTAHQMATRLAEEHFASAAAFQKLAYPSAETVSPWEGRLFPDTYFLSPSASAADIIQTMHQHLMKNTRNLPRPFPQVTPGKVLSLPQLITLASIVERETDVPSERALVAGVLLNRLRKNMRLQCDATVQYARELGAAKGQLTDGHKSRLLLSDLKIDSPYNTYRHGGLPPGPICNPGAASLKAAASPQSSDYLFYVWSPKLKHHLFATSYPQHLHNVRLVKGQ